MLFITTGHSGRAGGRAGSPDLVPSRRQRGPAIRLLLPARWRRRLHGADERPVSRRAPRVRGGADSRLHPRILEPSRDRHLPARPGAPGSVRREATEPGGGGAAHLAVRQRPRDPQGLLGTISRRRTRARSHSPASSRSSWNGATGERRPGPRALPEANQRARPLDGKSRVPRDGAGVDEVLPPPGASPALSQLLSGCRGRGERNAGKGRERRASRRRVAQRGRVLRERRPRSPGEHGLQPQEPGSPRGGSGTPAPRTCPGLRGTSTPSTVTR